MRIASRSPVHGRLPNAGQHVRWGACGCLIAAAAASAGCDALAGRGGPPSVVRDSAGIAIVENHRPRWDTSSAWRVSTEPILRLGSVSDGDTAQQFSYIVGAARLANGTVVVLEGSTTELRWFDAGGRHVRTSRLQGRGPGELPFVLDLVHLAGDTILLDGGRPVKQLFFAPTGEFAREEPLDDVGFRALGRWAECHTYVMPDRSRVVCQRPPGAAPRGPDPGPGLLRFFSQFVRVPWDLSQVDTMGLDGGIEQYGLDVGGSRPYFVVHPFHARSYLAGGGDPLRIAIVTNPQYSIEIWRPGAGLERIIRRVNGRVAPSQSQLDAVPEYLRRYSFDTTHLARVLSDVPVPDSLPAAAGLVYAPGGELLVARESPFFPHDTTHLDVFDAEGRFLGTLSLPPRLLVHEVGIDYILGVRYDDDDVPFVEVYRLERPQGSA